MISETYRSLRVSVLTLVLPLAACNPEAIDAFGEALATMVLVMMLVALVAAVVTVVWIGFQFVVIALNFVRPRLWTVVAGYALGAFQLIGIVFSVFGLVNSAMSEEPLIPDTELNSAIAGLVMGVLFCGLLGGSSYYGHIKLKEAEQRRSGGPSAGSEDPLAPA